MPLEWVNDTKQAPAITGASLHARGEPPLAMLHLWPHRSLPKRGFAGFILATFTLLLLPLLAVLGTPILWGLAPFVLGALWLMYAMIQKNYRDGEILEELELWSDHAVLTRTARGRAPLRWEANPYWISVHLHEKGGPVASYLTLKGAGREVELGAFLSEDERTALHGVLRDMLARVVATGAPVAGGTGD
ncbi:DUF2244 domain-containing protein [Meridianimarinicoccus roseus]|uniref:DUF2244 domain-containing protein n=1 Tax=Meridianimarinicoccus roseus TaxID=2072018 RepID=A0A2V2LDD5_9RHOB|nr:DUF2244 domain-containing protein [Meridianimarinicoccus roseus]PWR03538.1 DUF2244 domain-containing protein [Meridianimarinicoccus roseus]